MDTRKYVLQETALVAVGQAVCVAAIIGIFALLGNFDRTVLLGGIVGGVAATVNFFFMAMGAMVAADKAEAQNVTAAIFFDGCDGYGVGAASGLCYIPPQDVCMDGYDDTSTGRNMICKGGKGLWGDG